MVLIKDDQFFVWFKLNFIYIYIYGSGEGWFWFDQVGNLTMENSGEEVDDQGSGWFEVKKVCFSFILLFFPFLFWVYFHSLFHFLLLWKDMVKIKFWFN